MEGSTSASDTKGKAATEPEALPMGTVSELLRIGGSAGHALLSIVSGRTNDSVARVDSGNFSVVLVVRSGAADPLCLLSCMVGEHQWPLARDSPVLRVTARRFSFAFPGFFYGLTLPDGCFDGDVRRLESIFLTFCSYENHARERDYSFCTRRSRTDFWASAYAKIKKLSLGTAPTAIPRGPSGSAPPAPGLGPREVATLMWERALRTSAATKLVAKVLFGDAVDPDLHVQFTGPGAAAASTSAKPHGAGCYTMASLRAVTDVVDAVEAARGIEVGGWSMAPGHWAPGLPDGAMHWHFNVGGLKLVLRPALADSVGAEANADGLLQAGRGAGEGGSSSLGSGQGSGADMEENQAQMRGPPGN